MDHGLAQNKTALQALGYRQVAEHLRGERSLPETIELVKIRTRQFAKRQMTWFKRQLNAEWIELELDESPTNHLQKLVKWNLLINCKKYFFKQKPIFLLALSGALK